MLQIVNEVDPFNFPLRICIFPTLNAKIQANGLLARNKANKMVDTIQPYNLPLQLFRDKTLKQTLDLTCELRTVEHNSLTCNSGNYEALELYDINLLKHNNTP